MSADEEAENFFLVGQPGMFVPVGRVGQLVVRRRNFLLLEDAEQAVLAAFGVALGFLRAFDGAVENRHQLGAAAQSVHGAALDQRFQNALVQQAQVDLLAEFVDGAVAAKLFASGDDRLNGVVADILDRCQAETNRAAMRREVGIAHVDVRSFDGNAHLAALVDVLDHVIRAAGH